VSLHDEFVEVGGVDRVDGLQGEVIEDEQVDQARRCISASTVLSSRAALSRRNSWSAQAKQTVRRRRTAMCPSAARTVGVVLAFPSVPGAYPLDQGHVVAVTRGRGWPIISAGASNFWHAHVQLAGYRAVGRA
jgi:hypothetical protein